MSGLGTLTQEAYPSAPSQNALRKALGTAKTKSKRLANQDPFPTDINFEVPDNFKTLAFMGVEESFCLIDSGIDDPKRILGFTTPRLLSLLSKSPEIHGDGTFATVPNDSFYQIYSLHGKIEDVIMPMVFFLLPDKTAATYKKMLQLLKNAVPILNFNPKGFLVDFEAAAIKAIAEIFPLCLIVLCFFHFSQSLNRRIISLGLAGAYQEDEENRLLINQLKV